MVTLISESPERFYPPSVTVTDVRGFTVYIHRTTDVSTRIGWVAFASGASALADDEIAEPPSVG